MAILQSNPGASYYARKAAIDEAVSRALESRWYILGREVAAFETAFAAFLDGSTADSSTADSSTEGVDATATARAVGVASGTDALQVALRACGVGAGDLVFTVSHTAVATVAAVALCGAAPVYVDIDPDTYTMDAGRLEEAIKLAAAAGTGRPRAIVPVHLYGHPVDMEAISAIARRYDLRVIEDCAQSHGAKIGDTCTGLLGDIAAFSFYPTKNLGALGDGGAVVTNNEELAAQARLIREYGWKERYVSAIEGMNSRLDELQAAILSAKLPHLAADNAARARIAAAYGAGLADTALALPQAGRGVTHAWHQYVVRTPNRDSLRDFLREKGIGSLIHYPVPVHLQPAYARFATGGLPHTEAAAREVLSLPIYPELGAHDVQAIIAAIAEWDRSDAGS